MNDYRRSEIAGVWSFVFLVQWLSAKQMDGHLATVGKLGPNWSDILFLLLLSSYFYVGI